jgi:hypothetical protein
MQTACGVASDGLDVRSGIGSVEHVHIGRRHCERSKPPRLGAPHRRAIGGDIAKAPAMPQPANGQLSCCDVGKAKPP